MKYLVILAVTGLVMIVVVGFGQGAANTPSRSGERRRLPSRPPTTT
jgi:hypothetical protein